MKRWVCLLLGLVLTAFVFAGCGNDKGESATSEPSLAVPTVTPTAAPVQKAKAVLIKADSGLNVRDSASTDGEILGLADTGSMLPLLVEDEKDGWYQVQYQGKPAYVSAEYVEVKEITLEEYNRLKSGGGSSETSSKPSESSSASSKPEVVSSKEPESSAPASSRTGDSEDGE